MNEGPMNEGHPLRVAIDAVWGLMGDRTSLLADLPADAVLARSRSGERPESMARMLELLTDGGPEPLGIDLIAEVDEHLGSSESSSTDRNAIMLVLDLWWAHTLMFDSVPEGLAISRVLARLARLDVPLIRWLGPWLTDLDGPPARHFAELVLRGLGDEEWRDIGDLAGQVRGWARSEPVVMGITLVGGVHLDEGELSAVLDTLLSPDA